MCIKLVLGMLLFSAGWVYSFTAQELIEIRDGFNARRDAAMEQMRGEPLVIAKKLPPLSPGRGPYTRSFAWSITDFAMKSLWLNDQVDTANEALKTYSEYYISDKIGRNDRDSFYWASDCICRIVEFYGRNGSIAPGRLTADTEDAILDMMWQYARENSKVDSLDEVYNVYAKWDWGKMGDVPLPASANVERSKTWDVIESENHHMMKLSTLWHFSKLLSKSTKYQKLKYDDGFVADEHYAAWTEYAKEYCIQRAKKGLFVEMADEGYNAQTLKFLYNYYDFADDKDLSKVAGNLLTLYYASWAQEQIDGVRGGGKSRMYGKKDHRGTGRIGEYMWFYASMGEQPKVSAEFFTVITSSYRLPLIVIDLALDVQGRGDYELWERPLGLARDGFYTNPHYKLRTDYGGIVRYSYCTPDFIMGLPMVEARPFEDWVLISSQSRWQGVIFDGDQLARIYPQCKPDDGSVSFNQQWGVQKKGTMITQRLGESMAKGAGAMRVWFGSDGLSEPVENDGWAFSQSKGAYAAVRPARGGYSWQPSDVLPIKGRWMTLADTFSPVIIEVAQRSDFADYNAFQTAVKALPLLWKDEQLNFTGLGGHTFTFYADYSHSPKIDGKQLDYAPENVFKSPFINSKWDSGIVTITKEGRELVLDFVDTTGALNDEKIKALKDGFDARSKSVLESQVASPYPGIDTFVWNKQDFALSALMLNTRLDDANRAVIEACDYILENEKCPVECSLHWNINLFFRIYEYFNAESSHYPGRLSSEAEKKLIDVMWFWLESNSKISDADIANYKTWRIWGSENHDGMKNTSNWSAAKVLSRLPQYRDKKCKDGKTVEEHYSVWTDYFKEYLRERAIRGGLIEDGAHSYSKYTLQGWYNFYDFADDPVLQKRAEYSLDLWWTCWALEQIEGLRGSAKSRTYHDALQPFRDNAYGMCWFYFGIGTPRSKHPGIMCLAASEYKPADIIYDIALDIDGRGEYEFYTRKLGRVSVPVEVDGHNPIYIFDTERGGLAKYTYSTPNFVMGSFLQRKLNHDTDWAWISDQNRWSGVVFKGGKDAAVIPSCDAMRSNNRTNYNQYIGVQKNGAMLVRKIFEGSVAVGDMRVYFGNDMEARQFNDTLVAASCESGYVFAKPAWGKLEKVDDNWYRMSDSKSPLIIEATGKDVSLDEFVRKAASSNVVVDKDKAKAVYKTFDGHKLCLYFDDKLSEIDDKPIELYPDFTYKSPYLNSKWGDGKIVVQKGERKKILDFN